MFLGHSQNSSYFVLILPRSPNCYQIYYYIYYCLIRSLTVKLEITGVLKVIYYKRVRIAVRC